MRKRNKKLLATALTAALAFTTVFSVNGIGVSQKAKAAETSTTTEGGAITKKGSASGITTSDVVTPDNPQAFRDLNSSEIIAEMGQGWNLGNTFDGHGDFTPSETAWQSIKTTKKLITYVHDIGYNTIRIPVTWGTMINEDYSINEAWMSRVQEIIDYAIELDMYVIVNLHHDGADNGEAGVNAGWLNLDVDSDASDDKNPAWKSLWGSRLSSWSDVKTMYQETWKTISDRFKNYDEHLIYEAMNEVKSMRLGGWESDPAKVTPQVEKIEELNQLFVNTVRATGGNNGKRWIMASALNTNIGYATESRYQFDMPKDTNATSRLMLSVHDYDNFSAASYTESNSSSYAGQFKTLKQMYVDKGIPVIVGEYGFVKGVMANVRASKFEGVGYLLKKYNLVGCVWDDNGNYRLINRGHFKPYSPKAVAGSMRGYFTDKSNPEVITAGDYKAITLSNIEKITPSEKEVTLKSGETKKVTCSVTPENNNDVLLWSSDNPKVATVYNGKIRAKAVGKATITVRTISSKLLGASVVRSTITVNVTAATLSAVTTGISSDFASYTLNKGDEAFLNGKATPENGAMIYYQSADEDIVTVSDSGRLLANKIGTTKVTMTSSDGYTKDVSVTVKPKASDEPFETSLKLYALYNSGNLYSSESYGGTEESSQKVTVTTAGSFSLTYDVDTDLSDAAKAAKVSGLNGIAALYIKDCKDKVSQIQGGTITYDSIVVDGVEMKLNEEFKSKSLVKGSIVDTGNPINAWDGNTVISSENLTVDTTNYRVKFVGDNPKKITVNFTLSDLTTDSGEEEFYTGEDVSDETTKDPEPETPDTPDTPQTPTTVAKTGSLSTAKQTVVAAGSKKTVSYNATVAKGANKLAAVTASSNDKYVKVSVNQTTKKLTITADKKAVKGKTAVITLSSSGITAKLKVIIKNPVKKVKAPKKVTLKKKKSKSLTFKVTATNKKYAATDTVKATSSKKSCVKVVSMQKKAGKVIVKVKAQKKGSSKITVKVGSKKAAVSVKVK